MEPPVQDPCAVSLKPGTGTHHSHKVVLCVHNYMCAQGNQGRPQCYLYMCTPTNPAAANSRPAPDVEAPVNPCRYSTGTEIIKVLATYIHQSCKAAGQGWFQPSFWNQAVPGISSDFSSASTCGQLQRLHAPRACGGRAAPTVRSLENKAARIGPLPLPLLA